MKHVCSKHEVFCFCAGLKPGQRKVLFTCFKRNDKREVKVAQLAGSVAEMSSYHHGEVGARSHCVKKCFKKKKRRNISISWDWPLCPSYLQLTGTCFIKKAEREKPALFVMDLGGYLLLAELIFCIGSVLSVNFTFNVVLSVKNYAFLTVNLRSCRHHWWWRL